MDDNNNSQNQDTIGRAVNRYVSFRIVSSIIGGIIFLIFLFVFFIPMFNRMNAMQTMPSMGAPQSMPGGGVSSMRGTETLTIDGRPATPAEKQSFDAHFGGQLH